MLRGSRGNAQYSAAALIDCNDRQAAIGDVGIAAAVRAMQRGLKRINPFDTYRHLRNELREQHVALQINRGIDVVRDLSSAMTDASPCLERRGGHPQRARLRVLLARLPESHVMTTTWVPTDHLFEHQILLVTPVVQTAHGRRVVGT